MSRARAPDGSLEEDRVLGDDGEAGAQRVQRHVRHVHVVDENPPLGDVNHVEHSQGQRGLAAPRPPAQSDLKETSSRCNEMARPQIPGHPGVWSAYTNCNHLAPVTQSLD